ncbi:hypothetical protein [Candidatus Nitrospira allomarina]|uniref:Uncharacterized protein n=1 Tax=Candidatus Nitrospira allomarina TaxID=3020900 RepID=A0AA96GCC0_9BACT|nr:hypothetical protein [Candidatus Nitrospira allomarina]WNM59153.1 hypothetical protein PP769_05155 [Candidatus Nitrospira allomarina]
MGTGVNSPHTTMEFYERPLFDAKAHNAERLVQLASLMSLNVAAVKIMPLEGLISPSFS